MSNVHIRTVEDEAGNLIDLIYYHHGHGPMLVPEWPCPEALDYTVTCGDPAALPGSAEAGCGRRVTEVGLTADGLMASDPYVMTDDERQRLHEMGGPEPAPEENDEYEDELYESEDEFYEDEEPDALCDGSGLLGLWFGHPVMHRLRCPSCMVIGVNTSDHIPAHSWGRSWE